MSSFVENEAAEEKAGGSVESVTPTPSIWTKTAAQMASSVRVRPGGGGRSAAPVVYTLRTAIDLGGPQHLLGAGPWGSLWDIYFHLTSLRYD